MSGPFRTGQRSRQLRRKEPGPAVPSSDAVHASSRQDAGSSPGPMRRSPPKLHTPLRETTYARCRCSWWAANPLAQSRRPTRQVLWKAGSRDLLRRLCFASSRPSSVFLLGRDRKCPWQQPEAGRAANTPSCPPEPHDASDRIRHGRRPQRVAARDVRRRQTLGISDSMNSTANTAAAHGAVSFQDRNALSAAPSSVGAVNPGRLSSR